MLDFRNLTQDMKELIDSYTYKYGEGSCQHSFVSSFCLQGKYGDMFCEHDGFLYTLRSLKCTDSERVYLFPHGDRSNLEAVRQAVQNVLNDAHEHNARVRFETVTGSAAELILGLFPERFTATSSRDYSEYVYRIDELADIEAHKNIRQFLNRYKGRCEILKITEQHISMIKDFQGKWLEDRTAEDPDITFPLEHEDDGIQAALDNFHELGLSGIIILIDGELCGYEYGMPLSDSVYDSMVQKGNRKIHDIYRVLSREFPLMCCDGYTWLNWEEDTGSEGLRSAKMSYRPEYMIEKFIVYEAAAE